ncbi:uncharacterized protein B0I36DRAFT_335354 [Microdochium trichocladiopsis]|uniref:protein-L-isoaspartate(D-aspartate) O-methyltransferase n=1 Tax=Microdochium trichocladiopsis TaxID=1682393 RepID=A0A9P8XU21_9PEZI|nr:uncharacterized protein B0I36DRAFT_335354 [Microdochium trichocladiopsis]KAH7018129.1 hypothetical protein B0I36DRAFT_335354 [Microdochium trichocladiopsis]
MMPATWLTYFTLTCLQRNQVCRTLTPQHSFVGKRSSVETNYQTGARALNHQRIAGHHELRKSALFLCHKPGIRLHLRITVGTSQTKTRHQSASTAKEYWPSVYFPRSPRLVAGCSHRVCRAVDEGKRAGQQQARRITALNILRAGSLRGGSSSSSSNLAAGTQEARASYPNIATGWKPCSSSSSSTARLEGRRIVTSFTFCSRAAAAFHYSSARLQLQIYIQRQLQQQQQHTYTTASSSSPRSHSNSNRNSNNNNKMAWRSSGATNTDLIENLWRNGMLKSPVAKAAFLRVDRAQYCPSAATAYQDRPQGIGHGATISAPHMHANAVESLLPYILPLDGGGGGNSSSSTGGGHEQQGAALSPPLRGVPNRPRRVLDIGSGSGYLTHVLAELAGPDGVVVGLEHIRELQQLGEGNMRKSAEGRALLDSGKVRFRMGDGRKGWTEPASLSSSPLDSASLLGAAAVGGHGGGVIPGVGGSAPPPPPAAPAGGGGGSSTSSSSSTNTTTTSKTTQTEGQNGPKGNDEGGWDAIHVGAAAVTLHDDLLRQLRSPGRLFIPVEDEDGSGDQYIWTVDKDENGKITKKKLYGVRYVPLTDAPKPWCEI